MPGGGKAHGRDPYEPQHLLSLAVAAHLDGRRPDGQTGRQAFAAALNTTETNLSSRLSRSPDTLFDCARALELHRFARHGDVVGLARHLGIGRLHGDVSARMWPGLRAARRLGDPDTEPEFTNTVDVLVAAEAFAAYQLPRLRHPTNSRLSPREDAVACQQLLAVLCRLISGPYGVATQAARLAAQLVPLAPRVVREYISRGGTAAQLVRVFDLADAPGAWNSTTRHSFVEVLYAPPPHLVRRAHWMRALRRQRLDDFRRGADSPIPDRHWVSRQLQIAMRAEQSYVGARRWERRVALWFAAELTPDGDLWQRIVGDATDDEHLAELLPTITEMRAELAKVPLGQRPYHWFVPAAGWPTRISPAALALLDPVAARNDRSRVAKLWRWGRPATRAEAIRLLNDAVLGPCGARQRLAMDTLHSCGDKARGSAARTLAEVYALEASSASPNPVVLERCLLVLGTLGHRHGLATIEAVIRSPFDDGVFAQAALAAQELANEEFEESRGMMSFLRDRLDRALATNPDDELAVIGVRAAVVARHSPRAWLPALPNDSPVIDTLVTWADETLADPLLFPRRPL